MPYKPTESEISELATLFNKSWNSEDAIFDALDKVGERHYSRSSKQLFYKTESGRINFPMLDGTSISVELKKFDHNKTSGLPVIGEHFDSLDEDYFVTYENGRWILSKGISANRYLEIQNKKKWIFISSALAVIVLMFYLLGNFL